MKSKKRLDFFFIYAIMGAQSIFVELQEDNDMLIGVQTGGVVTKPGENSLRLGIDKGFEAIKAAGFEALDFNLDALLTWKQLATDGPVEYFSDEEWIKTYTEEIRSAAKKHGLVFGQFHAPFPTLFLGNDHANANMLDICVKCIQMCADCGCDKLVIHPRMHWDYNNPLSPEEEWRLNIEFYSALIPALKKNHVICCLENMWMQDNKTKKIYASVCAHMNSVVKYIDALNEIAGEKLFGFCLDVGHALIIGEDLEAAITELGDRLVTLHIHDNSGNSDDHTVPYIGGVCNWEKFLRGLRKIHYKGNLSFETAYALCRIPEELIVPVLRLIADMGCYFRSELQK